MKKRLIHKHHIYILGTILVLLAILIFANSVLEQKLASQPAFFGVSFSPEFAREIGLDPGLIYLDILTNMHAKNIRLNAYWNEIEPKENQFDFRELDWYVAEAGKHHASVILAVGFKLPRWPECRRPAWIGDIGDTTYLRQRQLLMVNQVILYYEGNPNITAFQIENEPLLDFGICPPKDPQFLEKEISLVRTLTKKPIIITDTGELSLWTKPRQLSDIFGSTLYRKVNTPLIGDIFYPLPPAFYRAKAGLGSNKKIIIAELQAELWAGQDIPNLPIQTQLQKFPLEQFQKNVEYARRTGIGEYYLWGVEWWYYLARHNHPEYLDYAKSLF